MMRLKPSRSSLSDGQQALVSRRSSGCQYSETEPAALGNSRIRGAGGNVYAALELLASLRRGVPFKDAVAEANRYWARCDDNENRYPDKFAKGQEQADAYKETLRSQRAWWKR